MSYVLKPTKMKFKDPVSGNYIGINAITDVSGMVIPNPPNTNGTYILKCTVSNGTKTYSWISES